MYDTARSLLRVPVFLVLPSFCLFIIFPFSLFSSFPALHKEVKPQEIVLYRSLSIETGCSIEVRGAITDRGSFKETICLIQRGEMRARESGGEYYFVKTFHEEGKMEGRTYPKLGPHAP